MWQIAKFWWLHAAGRREGVGKETKKCFFSACSMFGLSSSKHHGIQIFEMDYSASEVWNEITIFMHVNICEWRGREGRYIGDMETWLSNVVQSLFIPMSQLCNIHLLVQNKGTILKSSSSSWGQKLCLAGYGLLQRTQKQHIAWALWTHHLTNTAHTPGGSPAKTVQHLLHLPFNWVWFMKECRWKPFEPYLPQSSVTNVALSPVFFSCMSTSEPHCSHTGISIWGVWYFKNDHLQFVS